MSITTTFPTAGRLFADAPMLARRSAPSRAASAPVSTTAPKSTLWNAVSHFMGDALAAWATAGHLPR